MTKMYVIEISELKKYFVTLNQCKTETLMRCLLALDYKYLYWSDVMKGCCLVLMS